VIQKVALGGQYFASCKAVERKEILSKKLKSGKPTTK